MGDTKKVLFRRTIAVGDVLLTTPIVKAYKEKFPNSIIHYQTSSPQLLSTMVEKKYIDEIIISKADQSEYDFVYDLEYESDGNKNCIDIMARKVGLGKIDRHLVLESMAYKNSNFKPDFVIAHIGKTWQNREWIDERWKEVFTYIEEKLNLSVIQIGDKFIDGFVKRSNISWDITINLIKGSAFFIGVDSAPANIAKAFDKLAFVIYGCVDPKTRFCDTENEIPIWDSTLECRGCRGKSKSTFITCSKEKIYCIENISVQMVIDVINKNWR